MKTIILILAATLVSTAHAASTSRTFSPAVLNNANKTGQFGVGLQGGLLPGVGLDYWTDNDSAIVGAFSPAYNDTAISISYNSYFRQAINNDISPYIGVGALLGFGRGSDVFDRDRDRYNTALALQVPIGLQIMPLSQRFSVYGEIAPSLELTPISYGFLSANLGAKFYF